MNDFKVSMARMGKNFTDEEIREVMQRMNPFLNNTSEPRLTFTDFVSASIDKDVHLYDLKIKKVFKYFDSKNTGKLTEDDFVRIMVRKGDNTDEEKVRKAFRDILPTKKKYLKYADFCEIMGL
mmetsp:Transcript_23091/g.20029  ORF Transcript_23091/g.20029 Transcript_23091/m.20029 type:complete len:123 (+) Transcript_23091:73-441(+)